MSTAELVVTLTRTELRALLAEERLATIAELLKAMREPPPMLSAGQAAKRARRAPALVIAALRDKSLPAQFVAGTHGGKGHWLISPADCDAWAKARR